MKKKEGYITTREAAKMLDLAMSAVSRYFDRGILDGEKHPITNMRMVKKASVLALMKKKSLKWKEKA